MLRNMTIVEPWAASDAMLSRSGTGVLPAILVMMTVWDTSGSVYSALSAAAAPQNELTPGHTSYEMPSLSRQSVCSRIAP